MTDSTALEQSVPLPWQENQWQRLLGQEQAGKLAHAYLLAGPPGLGKLIFARRFARYLLCSNKQKGQACGSCHNCSLARQGHPDLLMIAPQEGSRDVKIAQIRELADFILLTSHAGGARIVIVDHAHAMNSSSANALLKTLEEPTEQTYLFLISDAPGTLLPTIRSRCQRVQFITPALEEAAAWLKQQLVAGTEEDEVSLLAAAGNRPLFALELAHSGNLEVQQDFQRKVCRLLEGKESIPALVSLAGKLGEKAAVGYLSQTSTILIKYLLEERQTDAGDSAVVALAQQLQSATLSRGDSLKAKLASLLEFYDLAQQAQQQLASSSNPNAQLIIESLLWRWRQLPLGLAP